MGAAEAERKVGWEIGGERLGRESIWWMRVYILIARSRGGCSPANREMRKIENEVCEVYKDVGSKEVVNKMQQ